MVVVFLALRVGAESVGTALSPNRGHPATAQSACRAEGVVPVGGAAAAGGGPIPVIRAGAGPNADRCGARSIGPGGMPGADH